jgi:hypothetical protein
LTYALLKDEKTYWIALMMIGSFTLSAQTTPEKVSEKKQLNEVAIIRTKKSGRTSRSNHFNFRSSLV